MNRRLASAALAAVLLGACLSPTLPLPPPSRPTVEGPDAGGNVRLTGRVQSGARVSALNPRTNFISGQQTGEDGAYDFLIGAEVGDEIVFWYTKSNMNSPSVVVSVPPPEQPPADSTGLGGAAAEEQ